MAEPSRADLLKTLTGLEFVRQAFAAGSLDRGIGRMVGMSGHSAEHGEVVLHGTPTEDHYNPLGTVHGGYAATLLDSAMGLATHTTLPPATGYATVDLKITYLRAMSKDSGPVVARGKVIHAGSRIVASEGWLTDKDGRLCAHATSTCMVIPPKPDAFANS